MISDTERVLGGGALGWEDPFPDNAVIKEKLNTAISLQANAKAKIQSSTPSSHYSIAKTGKI